ncbi:MAG: winged helix-turn-helix transcriptional regulator [Dehalococcoidia bacterium]
MDGVERSRDRILAIIQRDGSANVAALSQQVGLAPATIRRHLDILQRNGLVSFTLVRKPTGRPEHRFSLTENGHESMPKSYGMLLADLLKDIGTLAPSELEGKSGSEVLRESFRRIGTRIGQQHAGTAEKVGALMAVLGERGFMPDVEEGPTGVRVLLTNCPFRSAAREDSRVCGIDAAIISTVLDVPVRRVACINDGASCCTYVAEGALSGREGSPAR